MRTWSAVLVLFTTTLVSPRLLSTQARAPVASDYPILARAILKELIEIKSSETGVGSTPAALAMARRFRAAGFPAADIKVLGPYPRKQNLVVRLRGSSKAKPILIIGHLDVVEARAEDWSPGVPPFQLTERDGYLYGRGTQDMKGTVAVLVTNFIRWKREGWVPTRDLILALTADEEEYGDGDGVAWLVKHHRDLIDAEFCLNGDSGDYLTKDGKPYFASVAAAEKRETILRLETTNRGGHGSLPRKDNAINQLVTALAKVAALRFPAMLDDVTRVEFGEMAKLETGTVAGDMTAMTRTPADPAAVERLSADPFYNALLRTTCAATMLEAGHGPSALPQRARATLNCRILPWHTPAALLETLTQAIGDTGVKITWQFLETEAQPASPLRPEIFATLRTLAAKLWPGVVIMPSLDTGASDARFLRAAGIPSYGVAGLFLEEGDVRAHGRDERIRIKDFQDGVAYYDQFMKTLLSQP